MQLAAGDAHCPNGGAAVTSASGTAYVCNPASGGSGGSGPQVQPPIADAATFAQVNDWAGLPSDHAWTLCYKATRDNVNPSFIAYTNYGAFQFHSQCDNKGATFFVAKTAGGVVFGGYTARAWTGGDGSSDFYPDDHAFLFSVGNNCKHQQTGDYPSIATFDCYNYGPTFGAGHDFYTNLSTEAYVSLGNSYECRVGEVYSAECQNDYAGGPNPSMIELEVYAEQ